MMANYLRMFIQHWQQPPYRLMLEFDILWLKKHLKRKDSRFADIWICLENESKDMLTPEMAEG